MIPVIQVMSAAEWLVEADVALGVSWIGVTSAIVIQRRTLSTACPEERKQRREGPLCDSNGVRRL